MSWWNFGFMIIYSCFLLKNKMSKFKKGILEKSSLETSNGHVDIQAKDWASGTAFFPVVDLLQDLMNFLSKEKQKENCSINIKICPTTPRVRCIKQTQHHLKNLTRQAKTCEALMWQAHDYLRGLVPEMGFKFLDLGCAPGGFSSYLLQDPRLDCGIR